MWRVLVPTHTQVLVLCLPTSAFVGPSDELVRPPAARYNRQLDAYIFMVSCPVSEHTAKSTKAMLVNVK
jgi:hypothetical protein